MPFPHPPPPLETLYATTTPASMRVFPYPQPPTKPPKQYPTLGHRIFTGPRASSPIDE